jgi:hypothetical protein
MGWSGSNPGGVRFSVHIQPPVQCVPSLRVKRPGLGADLIAPEWIKAGAITLTSPSACLSCNKISLFFDLLIQGYYKINRHFQHYVLSKPLA